MKYLIATLFITFSCWGKSQDVVEEKIFIDTTEITYKVIYRETVGDYFQLKRAVFADDTSITAIEKNFSNGHQNGLTRIYYPSGKLRVKAIYGNDKLQGEWTHYGEDGIIITKGIYNYGIKNGYWAYKSEKMYGRYNKKGLKHRKWTKKDINNQKYKAFFWNGKLKSGSGIFNTDYETHADTLFVVTSDSSNSSVIGDTNASVSIDNDYIVTLKYIAQNYYLRKASKDYFRTSKKERGKFINEYVNLDKDVFRFNVAPYISPISINEFINQEKPTKPTIDSLIKARGIVLQEELNSFLETESAGFSKYATDNTSKIVVYLSKKIGNLIVVELIEFPTPVTNISYAETSKRTDVIRMKMLFLFNDVDEIIEVEYQKKAIN